MKHHTQRHTTAAYGNDMPEAYITRTKEKNRGRLKLYSTNSVYLENGESFELELFNATQHSVLAKIEINGTPISSTGLVLKPAQRVYLERYLDEDRKFLFDVYEVENWETMKTEALETNEVLKSLKQELHHREMLKTMTISDSEKAELEIKIEDLKSRTSVMEEVVKDLNSKSSSIEKAVKHNGSIKVSFYKEQQKYYNYDYFNNNGWTFLKGFNNTSRPLRSGNINSTLGGSIDLSGMIGDNTTYSTNSLSQTSSFHDTSASDSFNLDLSQLNNLSEEINEPKDIKETGRIEKGGASGQTFTTVNMDFESYAFHTVEYKLLPYSDKPIETSELKKYCSQCGKKAHPKDNFCSSCGNKL